MEQSMVHGLKFAPSQHCSSSDLIQTAIFNLFVMYLGEVIVHFTKF